jgi:hypothetical protein
LPLDGQKKKEEEDEKEDEQQGERGVISESKGKEEKKND